jgi:hypothetical protein
MTSIKHVHIDTVPRPEDWFDLLIVPLRALLAIAIEQRSSVAWS